MRTTGLEDASIFYATIKRDIQRDVTKTFRTTELKDFSVQISAILFQNKTFSLNEIMCGKTDILLTYFFTQCCIFTRMTVKVAVVIKDTENL